MVEARLLGVNQILALLERFGLRVGVRSEEEGTGSDCGRELSSAGTHRFGKKNDGNAKKGVGSLYMGRGCGSARNAMN
jgi:hypothetical protein